MLRTDLEVFRLGTAMINLAKTGQVPNLRNRAIHAFLGKIPEKASR